MIIDSSAEYLARDRDRDPNVRQEIHWLDCNALRDSGPGFSIICLRITRKCPDRFSVVAFHEFYGCFVDIFTGHPTFLFSIYNGPFKAKSGWWFQCYLILEQLRYGRSLINWDFRIFNYSLYLWEYSRSSDQDSRRRMDNSNDQLIGGKSTENKSGRSWYSCLRIHLGWVKERGWIERNIVPHSFRVEFLARNFISRATAIYLVEWGNSSATHVAGISVWLAFDIKAATPNN